MKNPPNLCWCCEAHIVKLKLRVFRLSVSTYLCLSWMCTSILLFCLCYCFCVYLVPTRYINYKTFLSQTYVGIYTYNWQGALLSICGAKLSHWAPQILQQSFTPIKWSKWYWRICLPILLPSHWLFALLKSQFVWSQ